MINFMELMEKAAKFHARVNHGEAAALGFKMFLIEWTATLDRLYSDPNGWQQSQIPRDQVRNIFKSAWQTLQNLAKRQQDNELNQPACDKILSVIRQVLTKAYDGLELPDARVDPSVTQLVGMSTHSHQPMLPDQGNLF